MAKAAHLAGGGAKGSAAGFAGAGGAPAPAAGAAPAGAKGSAVLGLAGVPAPPAGAAGAGAGAAGAIPPAGAAPKGSAPAGAMGAAGAGAAIPPGAAPKGSPAPIAGAGAAPGPGAGTLGASGWTGISFGCLAAATTRSPLRTDSPAAMEPGTRSATDTPCSTSRTMSFATTFFPRLTSRAARANIPPALPLLRTTKPYSWNDCATRAVKPGC